MEGRLSSFLANCGVRTADTLISAWCYVGASTYCVHVPWIALVRMVYGSDAGRTGRMAQAWPLVWSDLKGFLYLPRNMK